MRASKVNLELDLADDHSWSPKGPRLFLYTERHLKCVWFAPEFRPTELHTGQDDPVIVENPGRWNLEKGPDFLNAALRVGAGRRRVTGDVEVHIHPTDWQRHNHASDQAYARVIAHVTYFPGQLPAAALPPGAVQIALKDSLAANPLFSFETLDVTAYPFAVRKGNTPCAGIIARWHPEKIAALLAGAGRNRLERKAERLANAVAQKGMDQVLYEEIIGALGYKNNRGPFRRLAELVPLATLRDDSDLNPQAAYALLAGVAGLLPAVIKSRWDGETSRFVRQLWNYWWKQQAEWSARIMPVEAWVLSGVRPQNHPRRRLMAAAFLFTGRKNLSAQIADLKMDNAPQWIARILKILQAPSAGYWRRRLAIGRKASAAETALIGQQRAAAIVANVIIPLQMGLRRDEWPVDNLLACLPPEEDNAVIRQTAFNLIGPDHNPALYRAGLLQQGLIQIFHDFCLSDRSNCAECGLLKMIRNIA